MECVLFYIPYVFYSDNALFYKTENGGGGERLLNRVYNLWQATKYKQYFYIKNIILTRIHVYPLLPTVPTLNPSLLFR